MVVLMEECDELSQRCSKAIRFGMTEIQPGQELNNKQRIEQELGDLLAVCNMLGLGVDEHRMNEKDAKVRKFMAYSREQGQLD